MSKSQNEVDSAKVASATEVAVLVDEAAGPSGTVDQAPLVKNAFSPLGALAFGFAVINSWVVLVVGLGSGLASGGPTALVWGFVYSGLANMAMVLSLGEVFAVFPTAGGQYHFVAVLAPANLRAFASWATGLMNVFGLWLGGATSGYLSTVLILSLIVVNNPDVVITSGMQYGIFAAVIVLGPIASMMAGPRLNRWVDTCMTSLSVIGLATITITLLAMSSPKNSGSFVFAGVNNATGWDSTGIAWLIGVLQAAFAFLGFDLVFHISEEMPNPRKEGPRILNLCIIVSSITGLFFIISILFCIRDIDEVLGTAYLLPFAQVCMDATGSVAATSIFLLIPALMFINTVRGIAMTASRVLLSLGRDNALPYSSKFTVVKFGEPIYGVTLSLFVMLLCGLVQLGPSAAFNSLTGSATIMFEITYTAPIFLMLLGGRRMLNRDYPKRLYNLGRWGVVCNLVACFFTLEACVIYCFPAARPVTSANMNYVIVFVGFFLGLLGTVWVFWAKGRFMGPGKEAIMAIANRVKESSQLECLDPVLEDE